MSLATVTTTNIEYAFLMVWTKYKSHERNVAINTLKYLNRYSRDSVKGNKNVDGIKKITLEYSAWLIIVINGLLIFYI